MILTEIMMLEFWALTSVEASHELSLILVPGGGSGNPVKFKWGPADAKSSNLY